MIGARISRIVHVHIADHPGRNDPGSGTIDLGQRLDWLFAEGYQGAVGLEYQPVTADAGAVEKALRELGG